jgi:long-chain acyl-CoA synthetase
VKAAVALRPGHEVSAEALIEFCKERIAGYKCPKSIDFFDTLPKSTVGKILRREVKKKYSNVGA